MQGDFFAGHIGLISFLFMNENTRVMTGMLATTFLLRHGLFFMVANMAVNILIRKALLFRLPVICERWLR